MKCNCRRFVVRTFYFRNASDLLRTHEITLRLRLPYSHIVLVICAGLCYSTSRSCCSVRGNVCITVTVGAVCTRTGAVAPSVFCKFRLPFAVSPVEADFFCPKSLCASYSITPPEPPCAAFSAAPMFTLGLHSLRFYGLTGANMGIYRPNKTPSPKLGRALFTPCP